MSERQNRPGHRSVFVIARHIKVRRLSARRRRDGGVIARIHPHCFYCFVSQCLCRVRRLDAPCRAKLSAIPLQRRVQLVCCSRCMNCGRMTCAPTRLQYTLAAVFCGRTKFAPTVCRLQLLCTRLSHSAQRRRSFYRKEKGVETDSLNFISAELSLFSLAFLRRGRLG